MDPQMLTFYPAGIRVLLVDDDARFLRTASMLLSLLNFKVSTCGSPTSALKTLSKADKFKDVDVILADAKKVTTCGFDFKAIVEPDLHVPVLYFLSQNHRCAGAEADALLRALDLASFILKKPFDAEDACSLWRDVAWRKCSLNSRTGGAAVGGGGQGGNGLMMPPWAGSSDDGEEEERVHYRIVSGVKGGKRKNPGGPSGSSVPAAQRRGKKQKQTTEEAAPETMDNSAKPAPRKPRSKKARKIGAIASVPELSQAMDVEPRGPPQQPKKQSRFVQYALQTLDVPPYNPSIFADAVQPPNNIISISGAGSSTAAVPTASRPVFSAPAPTPPPAYQAPRALAPAVLYPPPALPVMPHQQQALGAGNIAPPAAATAMSHASTDKGAALSQRLCGAFGPFLYHWPRPSMQLDMSAPLTFATGNNIQLLSFQQPPVAGAGDPFTGTGGGAAIGAAGATHGVGDYGSTASTLMQSLQLGAAAPAQYEDDEVAGLMATYTTADPHLMVPQHVDDVPAMFYGSNNNAAMHCNNNIEPFVEEPHQVLGMVHGVNDPAMAGGAFDGNATAPQGFGAVPNVNQLTMGGDDLEAMFASDGNDDYSFPLEALMGTDMQMFETGLTGQQDGEGAADAAETYLNVGEGAMENWAVGSVEEVAMLDKMLMNNNGSDMFQYDMNVGRQ